MSNASKTCIYQYLPPKMKACLFHFSQAAKKFAGHVPGFIDKIKEKTAWNLLLKCYTFYCYLLISAQVTICTVAIVFSWKLTFIKKAVFSILVEHKTLYNWAEASKCVQFLCLKNQWTKNFTLLWKNCMEFYVQKICWSLHFDKIYFS